MTRKIARKTQARLVMKRDKPSIFGSKDRCIVFSMGRSNTKMREGRTVTQQITPSKTPFAMTIPKSQPRVKLIKQRAINPAMVVMELPTTEVMVWAIACAIASFLSPLKLHFSSE